MRGDQLPAVQLEYVVFQGGLDLVTPPLKLKPGACRAAENFECAVSGGYSRIAGYEIYAGQKPFYNKPFFDAQLRATFSGGVTSAEMYSWARVYGKTSGATARLLAQTDNAETIATYVSYMSGPNTYGSISINFTAASPVKAVSLFEVSGAFVAGEEVGGLDESGADIPVWFINADHCVITVEVAPVEVVPTDAAGATKLYNRSITAGTSISGLAWNTSFFAGSKLLALLPIAGKAWALSVVKSTIYNTWSIWASKPASYSTVSWSGGSSTSGVGYIPTEEYVLSSYPADFSGPPEYAEVVAYNFSGATGGEKFYIATGVGKVLVFDPVVETFSTIATGMAVDEPDHVAAHKNRLFLSFGGSLQYSTAGDPTSWTPVTGAGELAVGESIIKLQSVVGGEESVLLVYTTTRIYGLYGDTTTAFRLVLLASDISVEPESIQMLDRPIFLTDRGLVSLSASDRFGNFEAAALTRLLSPFLEKKRRRVVSSVVIRSKNQYRLFFDDGSGLYCTFDDGKLIGCIPVSLTDTPACFTTVYEEEENKEVVLFGGNESVRVFRMDSGTSFNGSAIDAFLLLTFSNARSARKNKAYRKVSLSVQSEGGYVAMEVTGETDFAAMKTNSTPFSTVENPGDNALSSWDTAEAIWDAFEWDGYNLTPAEVSLDGSGENISLAIKCSSKIVSAFTLAEAVFHFLPRRMKR